MSKRIGVPDSDSASGGSPIDCRRCELWERATQAILGEGPKHAPMLLVGEQPGNDEDLAGRPFVGPAGKLLREIMEEAGIDPHRVFLTNAVKHFVWELRGKRRLHKTPLQRHIDACNVWLRGEIGRIEPRVIVALGATALQAVMKKRMRIADARGAALQSPEAVAVVASYHPSAILRAPEAEQRAELRAALLDDLKRATKLAGMTAR